MRSRNTQFDTLMAERRGLLNQVSGLASKRTLTPDEQAQWDDLMARVEDIDQRLTALEDEQATEPVEPARSTGSGRRTPHGFPARQHDDDSALLRSWLRIGSPLEQPGDAGLLTRRGFSASATALELRAQAKSPLSAGGYSVPTGFLEEVSKALRLVAPVRSLARVISTASGEVLRLPVNDDTANLGEIVGEGLQNQEQDLAFSEVQLGAYKYSSKMIRVSNELLTDSGIDLSVFLAQQLGERIGRAQEAHFLTGTGSGQPEGVLHAAPTTSAASATALAADDLLNIVRDVNRAYIDNSGTVSWMMHPSIWSVIRRLRDGQQRPLIGDFGDGADLKLLGYPVTLTNAMDDTIASGKLSVLFGNFSQFAIRDVNGLIVARSADRFFEYDQVAFLAYQRSDSRVLQPAAFRALKH